MKNISNIRAQLAIPSLPLYFVSMSLLFTVLTIFIRREIVHENSFTVTSGVIAGLLFGFIMATSVAITRRRLNHALGTILSPKQQLSLNWSIDHAVLPQDEKLRDIFPTYIQYFTKVNRHSRRYIPIVMGLLTVICIWIYSQTHVASWLLCGGVLILLAIIGMRGISHTLHKLDRIAPRLQPLPIRRVVKPVVHRPRVITSQSPQVI